MRDSERRRLLYSRGFASIYGEWETTARGEDGAPHVPRVAALPVAAAPVDVALKKRQADNTLRDVWTTDVDPASRFVNAAPPAPGGQRSGRSSRTARRQRKVDLLVIGEGYTRGGDAEVPRATPSGWSTRSSPQEPFKSRRGDFNVRALDLPSAESGVNRPNAGVFRRTPISAEYNIFDSERYVLTLDNRALRDAASAAPYEFIEILVNERTYGGGGIFNDQATAVGRQRVLRLRVRPRVRPPLRGAGRRVLHVGRRLRDRRGRPKLEPWEPNVTALQRSGSAEVARPRHAGHAAADAVGEGGVREAQPRRSRSAGARSASATRPRRRWTRCSASSRRSRRSCWRRCQYARRVGAFEGASYEARGLYRPQADCIMFTRDRSGSARLPARHRADHRSVFEMRVATRAAESQTRSARLIGGSDPPKLTHQRRPERGR